MLGTRLSGALNVWSVVVGLVELVIHMIHRRLVGDLAFDVEKANLGLFCAIPIPSFLSCFQGMAKCGLSLMQRKNMVPGGFDIGGGSIWLGKTVADVRNRSRDEVHHLCNPRFAQLGAQSGSVK